MAQLSTTALAIDANLEGYYQLENGAITTDSSGKSRTLTNNGTTGTATGKYGDAADFGASNTTKYLNIVNNMGISGGNCSLSAWVKLTTAPATTVYQTIVAQQANASDVNYQINYFNLSGTYSVRFWRVRQGTSIDEITYTYTLPTSTWTHLVLTYDGTNLRGYVDGTLQAGPTSYSGNGTGTNADGFSIGADTNGGTKFSGLADDVAIFSKALSDSEVSTLYADASASTTGSSPMFFSTGGVTLG